MVQKEKALKDVLNNIFTKKQRITDLLTAEQKAAIKEQTSKMTEEELERGIKDTLGKIEMLTHGFLMQSTFGLSDEESNTYDAFMNTLSHTQRAFFFNSLLPLLENFKELAIAGEIYKQHASGTINQKMLDALKGSRFNERLGYYGAVEDLAEYLPDVIPYTRKKVINEITTALEDTTLNLTVPIIEKYLSFLQSFIDERMVDGKLSNIPRFSIAKMAEYFAELQGADIEGTNIEELIPGKEMVIAMYGPSLDYVSDFIKLIKQAIEPFKKAAGLPALSSFIPKVRAMPNTKLSNTMPIEPNLFDTVMVLDVIPSKGKGKIKTPPITTSAILTYEGDNIEIYDSKNPFTAYDRSILDTISSIWASGQQYFTAETVYRAMTNKQNSEFINPITIEEVAASIEKSLRTMVEIDLTEEAKARNYNIDGKIISGWHLKDYLLSARTITLRAGGMIKQGYQFNTIPILYDYARLSKQIINVRSEYLNLSSEMNVSNETIVIRDFLFRQIEQMKNPNGRRNEKITYESIYKEIDVTQENYSNFNKKTSKVRISTKKILTALTNKEYIKGFDEYPEGRIKTGLIIEYEK